MKFKNDFSVLIVIIFAIVMSFLLINNGIYQKTKIEHIKYIIIAGTKLKVDLALTKEEQMQGLSGRNEFPENHGMLFVFDHPDKYLFWMKNMNFPIDIIWIGEDMKVVYIKKDAKPELYLETYGSEKDAKYVLEVIAGFSEKNNLKEGDKVEFTY